MFYCSEPYFNVIAEGYKLLALDGNCGRKLRRFLLRNAPYNIVGQIFSYEDSVFCENPVQTAEKIHLLNMEYLSRNNVKVVKSIGTISDKEFNLVQNSYSLKIDVNTASVKELKESISFIIFLAEILENVENFR